MLWRLAGVREQSTKSLGKGGSSLTPTRVWATIEDRSIRACCSGLVQAGAPAIGAVTSSGGPGWRGDGRYRGIDSWPLAAEVFADDFPETSSSAPAFSGSPKTPEIAPTPPSRRPEASDKKSTG